MHILCLGLLFLAISQSITSICRNIAAVYTLLWQYVCWCTRVPSYLHKMRFSLQQEDILLSHWCTHGMLLETWLIHVVWYLLPGRARLSYSVALQALTCFFCCTNTTVSLSIRYYRPHIAYVLQQDLFSLCKMPALSRPEQLILFSSSGWRLLLSLTGR